MLNITKIINFFKAAIDIINKFVYNVKGYLCVMAIFIMVIVIWAELPIFSSEGTGRGREAAVFELAAFDNDNSEEICVTVSLRGGELCGMMSSLQYDAEAVELVGAFLAETPKSVDFGFLTNDDGGEVLFVLDGGTNISQCELVTFVFKPISDADSATFSLSLSSAYCWDKEIAREIEVLQKTNSLTFFHGEEAREPKLTSACVESTSGQLVLNLCGAVGDCFAAGFDVYLVDLSTLEGDSCRMMSVLPIGNDSPKQFTHVVPVSGGERLCVIVKPISFAGKEEILGTEKIFMIDGGEQIY